MIRGDPGVENDANCVIENDSVEAYEEKLSEILSWIGDPNLIIIHNHKKIMRSILEDEMINVQNVKEAVLDRKKASKPFFNQKKQSG